MPYFHHVYRLFSKRLTPLGVTKFVYSKAQVLQHETGGIYFGYHDKSPFNLDGTKLLVMHLPVKQTDQDAECTPVKLGFYRQTSPGVINEEFVKVGSTSTWCWQQGCMLQWDPASPDKRIYFNDLVNGRYGSKLFNLNKQQLEQNNNFPIYSISGDGTEALSLNFSRLGRLRPGYGYNLISDPHKDNIAPAEDGVFLYDLSNGQGKLLVNLKELANLVPHIKNVDHYINHASFSPAGKWITFFHIWRFRDTGKRGIILYGYNRKDKKLFVIEKERLPSHFCWQNENTMMVTNMDIMGNWQYSLYNLSTGNRLDLNIGLKQDGHPMFKPGSQSIFVTDTYPDKRRDQHLLIVDLKKGEIKEIDALYSPYTFSGSVRCDLHPRWDRLGRYICVDFVSNYRRNMKVYKL